MKSENSHAGIPEPLRRFSYRCPGCSTLWFLPGLTDDAEHICKRCHHRFRASEARLHSTGSSPAMMTAVPESLPLAA